MVTSRSELSVAVVEALAVWTQVELQLAELFATLSNIQTEGDKKLRFRKAYAIFDAIISFDARLAVIDILIEEEGLPALEAEIWNRLSIRLRKLYKRRHSLAHFTLAHKVGQPENDHTKWDWRLSPFFTASSMFRPADSVLTIDQIREREIHFQQASMAIAYFNVTSAKKRGRLLASRMQEPPLVAQLRVSASQILEERARKPGQPPEGSGAED